MYVFLGCFGDQPTNTEIVIHHLALKPDVQKQFVLPRSKGVNEEAI